MKDFENIINTLGKLLHGNPWIKKVPVPTMMTFFIFYCFSHPYTQVLTKKKMVRVGTVPTVPKPVGRIYLPEITIGTGTGGLRPYTTTYLF